MITLCFPRPSWASISELPKAYACFLQKRPAGGDANNVRDFGRRVGLVYDGWASIP